MSRVKPILTAQSLLLCFVLFQLITNELYIERTKYENTLLLLVGLLTLHCGF